MRFCLKLLLSLGLLGNTAFAADDVVTTIKRDGEFSLFLKAIETIGFVQMLDHGGSYTVFAPTDAAFSRMPPGLVDDLFKPENKQKLTELVEAHLLRGKLSSSDIKTTTVTTFAKSVINTDRDGAEIRYGSARIVKRDILASNGLIQAIDRVVLPSQEESLQSTTPGETKKPKRGAKN